MRVIDICYHIENSTVRLRSHNDVKAYCQNNKIEYVPGLFNFSCKETTSGKLRYFSDLIDAPSEEATSEEEVNLVEVQIPKSFKQASKAPEADYWKGATTQEIKVMEDRHVWDQVDPPTNAKGLGSRWVCTVK